MQQGDGHSGPIATFFLGAGTMVMYVPTVKESERDLFAVVNTASTAHCVLKGICMVVARVHLKVFWPCSFVVFALKLARNVFSSSASSRFGLILATCIEEQNC